MKCVLCGDEVQDFVKIHKSHLVVQKDIDSEHIHVHGDLDRKEDMRELIDVACEEIGIVKKQEEKVLPKEIVLHNRQRIGDILMFTCGVRDFKKAFPDIRLNARQIH